jgi:hypothetical protein
VTAFERFGYRHTPLHRRPFPPPTRVFRIPSLAHSPAFSICDCAGYPNPDIMAGIEAEHCNMYGAEETLETTIPSPTTPRKEFEFVMGRQECPPKQMVDGQGNTTRVIRPIDDLQEERLTAKAGLTLEEIVAVVCAFLSRFPPHLHFLVYAGQLNFVYPHLSQNKAVP